MRLLDTETGQFVDKDPERTKYAILSHTWDTEKGEQTYEELKKIQRRYGPGSQAPQSRPRIPEGSISSSPEQDRGGPPSTPPPSQLPSDSPSATTRPPTALERLTQSEVEALFRAFVEAYGLASPPPALASSDPSAPSQEHQSKPPPRSIWDDPELSPKVQDACAVARANGYRYIWIDSCCIDKSSSSELSEAINSMYEWYGRADICYAYLADVPPGDDHQAKGSYFRNSRWFTRGWTLQELIAPAHVVFLSEDWAFIGSKHALVNLVESVTNINYKALLKLEPLDAFSVAQRLSWAANREATRTEDRAYSLLGIFDIHMPTLYGEGSRAFRRLQEQIMQRIPDQSLFAWGRVHLASQVSQSPDLADTPNALRAEARRYGSRRELFTMSPDSFKSCEGVSTPCRDTTGIQSPASHRPKIEYTSTPYGICTQFHMIPLTRDLLLGAIPHSEDVQLEFRSPEDYQWYLAILGCEHTEHPGHLLGRVCYIPPSESGVEFVYTGYIDVQSRQGDFLAAPDLFPLSPETIEHCRPHTELKTVYIPHPDRADLPSSLRRQPYDAIKLVLLGETRDALRSRGYSADLRDPDPDHPTTHWLTLSTGEHTITVEFRHTLEYGGQGFTIDAEVKMSGSRVQIDEAPDESDQAAGRCTGTVSWTDLILWSSELGYQKVMLSAAGAGTLTVELGVDFAGTGVYFLRVDVLSDAQPAS